MQASIDFTEVKAKVKGVIVVGANEGRSHSEALSMGDTRQMLVPHEFGHHLGNGDEYPGGVGIDTSANTDGATAGIDNTSVMGCGSSDPKARNFTIVSQHLSALIKAQEGVEWTFDIVPHV